MDHNKKANFLLKLHKMTLQHFDIGGPVGGPMSAPGTAAPLLSGPAATTAGSAVNPANNGLGGGIATPLGLSNTFQASGAPIQQGTNAGQLNAAYNGAQSGIRGQQSFANNASAQNGFGNQNAALAQQEALANQLQTEAAGGGPNPALAELSQATGQNVANQAALMASQRGAGANTGLIARQAAQQGAATEQNAAGQAATLSAQQQLAAQSALANQQAQIQNVAANQIAAQDQGANAVSQAEQNEQGILQGANTAANNATVASQGNVNNVNAQVASGNQQSNGNIIGAIGNGLSSLASGIASIFAKGGEVQPTNPEYPSVNFAQGGLAAPPLSAPGPGPTSFVGQWLNTPSSETAAPQIASAQLQQIQPNQKSTSSSPAATTASLNSADYDAGNWENQDGTGIDTSNPANLPGGANFNGPLPQAKGGMIKGKMQPRLDAKGGKVSAQNKSEKAVKKDNSYANDKVPAMLSAGEIVLPRSVTMHPMAPQKAAQFVQAVLNKRRMTGRAA